MWVIVHSGFVEGPFKTQDAALEYAKKHWWSEDYTILSLLEPYVNAE